MPTENNNTPTPNTAVSAPLQRFQTSLFDVDAFIDRQTSRIMGESPVKGKDGVVVGVNVTLRGRKEIAKNLNLTKKADKAELDAAIMQVTDAALGRAKGVVAGLSKDWTLRKLAVRTVGNEEQITLVARKVKRASGPSDEQIAAAMGMTVEEVAVMRAKQLAKINGVVEVESSVTSEPATPAAE